MTGQPGCDNIYMIMNLDSVNNIASKTTFSTHSHTKAFAAFFSLQTCLLDLFEITALALLCVGLSLSKQSQASLHDLNYFCIYFPFEIT